MSTHDPINTAPIQKFIQQVRSADASKAKEVKLDIATARALALTLGAVEARLHGDLEQFIAQYALESNSDEPIEVRLDGQSWN